MGKIYIIGDSFASLITVGNVTSWSKLISENYPIEHIIKWNTPQILA
jgi:hypothetical protein